MQLPTWEISKKLNQTQWKNKRSYGGITKKFPAFASHWSLLPPANIRRVLLHRSLLPTLSWSSFELLPSSELVSWSVVLFLSHGCQVLATLWGMQMFDMRLWNIVSSKDMKPIIISSVKHAHTWITWNFPCNRVNLQNLAQITIKRKKI